MLGLGAGINPIITNMHNQGYLNFNGSDEFVDIDNIAGEINYQRFSISCWVRVETTSSSGFIFRVMVSDDTDNQLLLQYHASGNEIRANSKLGGVSDLLNQGTNTIEGDSKWHHIVFVVDAAGNDNSILYVDNVAKETIAGVGTLSGTFSKASIGNNTIDGGYFKGDIDEVAIWNRVITPTEIATIHNAQVANPGNSIDIKGQMGTSLIGYYRFEEKSGAVAINDGSGENGTIYNTPTYRSH